MFTQKQWREEAMTDFEYTVIRAIQILDAILVAILPWLKWLIVSGFSAVFWVLGHRHPP